MNSGFIIWEYPLLKRLVVYRFIPMSMHDLLGFEGYIPKRHALYYDGKQSKWEKKKPEGTICPIGNFQIWKNIYINLCQHAPGSVFKDIQHLKQQRVLHLHYLISEDIHFVLWICNRNEITNAIELESLEEKLNFKPEIRSFL